MMKQPEKEKTIDCQCHSGKAYELCCGPLLAGSLSATTAESLMRSRYSAYRTGNIEYILRTWHRTTRPESIDPATLPNWIGLDIIKTAKGHENDKEGMVEFKATAMSNLSKVFLHEQSFFVKEDGEWFYVSGETDDSQQGKPVKKKQKIGRNSPCPCGSGKKYKKCCGG